MSSRLKRKGMTVNGASPFRQFVTDFCHTAAIGDRLLDRTGITLGGSGPVKSTCSWHPVREGWREKPGQLYSNLS